MHMHMSPHRASHAIHSPPTHNRSAIHSLTQPQYDVRGFRPKREVFFLFFFFFFFFFFRPVPDPRS
jgi:hypothetical protein